MVFNDANRVLRPVPHVGVGEVQGLLSGIERIIKSPWERVPAFDFEDEERLRAVICGTFHPLSPLQNGAGYPVKETAPVSIYASVARLFPHISVSP